MREQVENITNGTGNKIDTTKFFRYINEFGEWVTVDITNPHSSPVEDKKE